MSEEKAVGVVRGMVAVAVVATEEEEEEEKEIKV